jgi:uncharacterized RDD family membrane protein YckC
MIYLLKLIFMNSPIISPPVRYAGFWIRLFASFLDGVILTFINFILAGGNLQREITDWRSFVPFLYLIVSWIAFSATPGKLICGLKIVGKEGNDILPQQILPRLFGYALSVMPVFLGFIWIALNKQKQGWHDTLAKTWVIKTR